MVNIFCSIQKPAHFERCRISVISPVNKLCSRRSAVKSRAESLKLELGLRWVIPFPHCASSLFDDRQPLRLGPAQMLTPVQGDHLAGHCWRRQDKAHGGRNLLWAGAAMQRHRRALPDELFGALTRARQCRTGSDAVHADPRCEGERHRPSEGPQSRFRQRV